MMLFRTLFGRLLLVFMLFGVVMTGALLFVMQVTHRNFHREFDQTVNHDLARNYVAANFLLTDAPLTAATLHRGIRKLAAANPEVDIYLVDNDGRIVASSVPASAWQRARIGMKPVHQFMAGQPAPLLGDDPRDASQREVFSAAAFHVADCPGDYLYVVLRGEEDRPGTRRLRTNYAVGEGAGVILVAAVLAVALSLLFLRLLTRRLGVLEVAMRRFRDANGIADPAARAARASMGDDEIDRLEALFGDLATRIRAQVQELESRDVMRREIIANVSHDLRTPLTTLLAHLETLQLKLGELTPAECSEYLDVAMRQSQRIGRLVEQLLEAARLEAGQVEVEAEPFPIGELLQDVAQKFALAAAERGVSLDVDAVSAATVVRGDIGLLERVMDNLIDNALRHTPRGGSVSVQCEPRGGLVRVAVTDTGPGLKAAEAARVFDRFYRGDKGRSPVSGRAGLGLAIVASILELHGTRAFVESEPGHGARFYFDLPIAKSPPPPGA